MTADHNSHTNHSRHTTPRPLPDRKINLGYAALYLGDRRGRTRDQRYGRCEGALEAPALPAPGHGEFTAGRAE
jgi:hypothetical protein